jgi:hypothetical protein
MLKDHAPKLLQEEFKCIYWSIEDLVEKMIQELQNYWNNNCYQ